MLLFLVKYGKIIGIVASLFTIGIGFLFIKNYYERVGYDRAVTEIQKEAASQIVKAVQKAIRLADERVKEAMIAQQKIFDDELERVKRERIVEVITDEIIKEVETVKIVNECNNIGLDVVWLLNESVRAANSTPST